MKKSRLFHAVTSYIFLFFSTPIAAVTVIDTLEDIGTDGSIVNFRNIDGIGINISVGTGIPIRAFTYFVSDPWAFGLLPTGQKNTPLNPDNLSGERFISAGSFVEGFAINNPVIFDFSSPIAAFGLTTIDLLVSGTPSTDYLSLIAFDVDGNTVDIHSRTGTQGDHGIDVDWFVSSAANDIIQVHLAGNITWDSGYGIDDLVLNAYVPIPPALYLFGSGLLGLIGVARKKTV